jgi:F0F1-type ATP synthase assembly protein I
LSDGTEKTNYKIIANWIALIQLFLSVVIAALLLIALDFRAAYSAVIAGFISALATYYMGQKLFSINSNEGAKLLAILYTAEIIKILCVVTLIFTAFIVFKVHGPIFLLTYAATMLVYVIALVWPKIWISDVKKNDI